MLDILREPANAIAALAGVALLAYFIAFSRVIGSNVMERQALLNDPGVKRRNIALIATSVAIILLPGPYKALGFIALFLQALILERAQDRRLAACGASPRFLGKLKRISLLSYLGILGFAAAFLLGF